jgi:hypothetical protein
MDKIDLNHTPKKEIENTLRKYFSNQEIKSITNLLDLYNLNDRPRLIMACIKLSKGNFKELNSYLFHATDYCMEFIAKAESQPEYNSWVRSSILD